MIYDLHGDQFEMLVQKNRIIFIEFWATWCVPCKQFAQIYERVATHYSQIIFAKVNVEQEKEFAEIFQIRSIPHVMIFKDGIAIYSEAGVIPESTLRELAQQSIDADVSSIRAQLVDDQQTGVR